MVLELQKEQSSGSQEVLHRFSLASGQKPESLVSEIEEKIRELNLPVRSREDSFLANIAFSISDKGVERSSNNLTDRIAGIIYQRAIKEDFNLTGFLGRIEPQIYGQEGLEIYQTKGISGYLDNIQKITSFEEETGFWSPSIVTPRDRANLISAQIEYIGDIAGKPLEQYSKEELKIAREMLSGKKFSRQTVGQVIESGEIAAKIMRFRV